MIYNILIIKILAMIKRKAPLSLLVTLDSISKNTLDFFFSEPK